ncbi:arylsulfatase [Planctomicrobium piriforme]|uniref:Arylsulfatase n=1 Tax=Planctomicrobium piriforme TaxID=1576369 RepID=A0A1I3SZ24_9PLAN|nr:arylsulfatase [Planctomicrobium piriforme]SFJ63502.1 arylsulfatase [Planctomicrobium piriforme]
MLRVCHRSGITPGLWGVMLLLGCSAAHAQQAGSALPYPDPPFKGKIEETIKDSIPDYPQAVKPPAGAPNVLIILLDDVGFGMTGTFGGPVPTPNLDKLAANGLKYNRFHTTALCSPTRAALLAGRNHHSVGTGVIIEMGTGFPGYTGIIPRDTALVSQILADNGYATAAFGKWHNTPETEISPAGPFDRWPTGMGFNNFYGFNQGETNQYHPTLYRNVKPVNPPKTPEQGYHFTTDMTDETIAWIHNVGSASPEMPWFAYYAPGACHAPHQAPQEWRDKFKGQFEYGWDRQRKLTFSRQRQMGVIPADSVLTLRPPEIPAWDEQPVEARQIYSKLMENYAGFMAHTDFEIGRLITSLEQSGELDNTLIFYIVGDNGASAEGGLEGTFNEIASLAGYNPGVAGFTDRVDQIGGPKSEPHVPVGWAWAMDTPFKWTKQVASHFGGTRNPLVVHWPKGIKAKNEVRSQFHHVIDVVPTILDVAGIPEPKTVNGIPQKPIEGISMRYSFDDKKAKERRETQYFEMLGNRAIYHNGFIACARHGIPWVTTGSGKPFYTDQWELYNLNEDFTQATDTAARNPMKVKELKEKFMEEAKKYNVLPLDDRLSQRLDPRLRNSGPPRMSWTYYGNDVWLPEPIGPSSYPRSHAVTIDIKVPDQGAEGVIACAGGDSGGWTIYVKDGKLCYLYNFFMFEEYAFEAQTPLPPGGPATIKLEFASNGMDPDQTISKGGTMQFFVNGQSVGQVAIAKAAFRHGVEPFEIGRDSISSVSSAYADKGTFPFNGTIEKVEFQLKEK